MRKLILFFFLFILMISVSSWGRSYRTIDPTLFNNNIRSNPNIKTATDLMFAYDPRLVDYVKEQPDRLSVTAENIGDGKQEITAIINVNDDDELAGEKYVMTVEHKNEYWKVMEIRYSMKFQPGYGHTDWGTEK